MNIPELVLKAEAVAARAPWQMSCGHEAGMLLRALASTKRAGRFLELGSAIGVGAAWILDGMDTVSTLTTVEIKPNFAAVCRDLLKDDSRVDVVVADASAWVAEYSGPRFDFIFVDTTFSKFDGRDGVLDILLPGGILVADDLLPQEKWVDTHPARVERFRQEIVEDERLAVALVDWGSGLVVGGRR